MAIVTVPHDGSPRTEIHCDGCDRSRTLAVTAGSRAASLNQGYDKLAAP